MKRLKIISAALCILIPLAGCSVNNKAPAGEGAAPDTSVTYEEASTVSKDINPDTVYKKLDEIKELRADIVMGLMNYGIIFLYIN